MSEHYDVAVIGSGFSGSILARILATRGRRVILLDSARHPRFTIGESSTPIADLLLERLGQQYGLPDLVDLASYGRWQKSFPKLACGMKRGFSYFDHRHPPGSNPESFLGQRSLIVAASPTDAKSDTHWYRSEVDALLFRKAVEVGVEAHEETAVIGLEMTDSDRPRVDLETGARVTASHLIDASGSAAVSARLLGLNPLTDRLRTRTGAAFAHFEDVESFSDAFNLQHGDQRASDPFDADDAAQHHLIDEGWAWMLRLNNAITSVGVTAPLRLSTTNDRTEVVQAARVLRNRFAHYPDLFGIMRDATLVAPSSGIVSIERLQRLYDPVISKRCLMMPTTAVTIDPLHSTGIAHALAGVGRIAEIVLESPDQEAINRYRDSVLAEADHIDRMVAMAYDAIDSFPRFTVACMVYFAAAIASEERLGSGETPKALWQADDLEFTSAVRRSADLIRSDADDAQVRQKIRDMIKPWNTAGLLNETNGNRYAYTATK